MKVKAIGSASVSLVWEIDGCREERFSRFKIYVKHKSYLACEDKTVKDKLRVQNIYDYSQREVYAQKQKTLIKTFT